jgi:MFS transporter, PPP family, 3-phenylpropionic acid transporter
MPEVIRLSFYYTALFAVVGVLGPFWPVWLAGRGLSAAEVGLILTTTAWARVMVNPFIAQAADRYQAERRFLLALSALALVAYLGFQVIDGFWPLLALSAVAGISFNVILPIGEKQVLARVYARGLDYGRLRLWGSLSFMATAWIAGQIIDSALGVEGILWVVYVCLALTFVGCFLLPQTKVARKSTSGGGTLKLLLRNRAFLLFLIAASLIQASHGAYYGFASIHWQANGMDGSDIALLWAVAVVVEIMLFAMSGWLHRTFGVARLLMFAAAAGIIRWTAMGMSADPWLMFALQPLHALTFGAAHLGAMHFIAQAIPERAGASAQSLYAAVGSGITMGLAIWLSGQLYDSIGGAIFYLMVGFSGAGLIATFALARVWSGERLLSD